VLAGNVTLMFCEYAAFDPCGNTFPQQHGQTEAPAAWQRGQHVAAKLLVGFP